MVWKHLSHALNWLHSKKISHNDVAPDNAMLEEWMSNDGKVGYKVILIDLGLATECGMKEPLPYEACDRVLALENRCEFHRKERGGLDSIPGRKGWQITAFLRDLWHALRLHCHGKRKKGSDQSAAPQIIRDVADVWEHWRGDDRFVMDGGHEKTDLDCYEAAYHVFEQLTDTHFTHPCDPRMMEQDNVALIMLVLYILGRGNPRLKACSLSEAHFWLARTPKDLACKPTGLHEGGGMRQLIKDIFLLTARNESRDALGTSLLPLAKDMEEAASGGVMGDTAQMLEDFLAAPL